MGGFGMVGWFGSTDSEFFSLRLDPPGFSACSDISAFSDFLGRLRPKRLVNRLMKIFGHGGLIKISFFWKGCGETFSFLSIRNFYVYISE